MSSVNVIYWPSMYVYGQDEIGLFIEYQVFDQFNNTIEGKSATYSINDLSNHPIDQSVINIMSNPFDPKY